ncbi:hypothetical protein GCM10010347_24700 [Streptomyces cirratus]|uniref:Uncharacterized protein n=1 Tax=Streptomyces cirratus TaxID=68187 RepID=A0ABQ3ER64_9ACTN|nr:hypothetical protein GCM10010347_24700 [Streptomyces cirratus]
MRASASEKAGGGVDVSYCCCMPQCLPGVGPADSRPAGTVPRTGEAFGSVGAAYGPRATVRGRRAGRILTV